MLARLRKQTFSCERDLFLHSKGVDLLIRETHLEEACNRSSSTLVSVHPSHETTGLDVCSTSVVGDALETPHTDHFQPQPYVL